MWGFYNRIGMCVDMGNIGHISDEARARRMAETQINLETKLKEAKFVKTGFEQPSVVTEHMWVEITSIDYGMKIVHGILANDPVFLTLIKCDDVVEVPFATIEEIFKE
jgi:uncharacterized protein YegJ (DUF2314 family)